MSDQPPPSGDLQFDRAEPAKGPAGSACAFCHEPITSSYYEVNGLVGCERCRYKVEAEWNRGSPAARFWRAAGLGVGAAIVGAAVWYGITLATDTTWGIVAVGVGLLVGGAVRKGSDGRGGWRYQTLAMALTYLAIAAAQAPIVLDAIREAGPLDTAVFFLASPILVGVQSIILLLIYSFALYEAWKLNQKVELRVTGPYAVGSVSPA